MASVINGFVVVRKSLGGLEPYHRIYRMGNKEYLGLDRISLEDVRGDYYQKKLPPEIRHIVKAIDEASNDTFFMPLITNYTDAIEILRYSNNRNALYELAAVSSDILSSAKGTIEFDDGNIDWLGYDIVPFGGSSLILHGLFFKPGYFSDWVEEINQNGLFTHKDRTDDYIKDYVTLAKDNIVEAYGLTDLDTIRIGRVRLPLMGSFC